jgi:predicted RNase H-like HicB family nuclease
MKKRLYPAVLERGSKGTFGAWFPDFPDCVAGGRTHEETIEKAEHLLAKAVDALAERGGVFPEPTPIERIALPKGSDFVAYFIVRVTPPDPSERVNVYLPGSLIERIDKHAAEHGMTRSSFFGLAATYALRAALIPIPTSMAEPRSKARTTGALREKTSPPKKPSR